MPDSPRADDPHLSLGLTKDIANIRCIRFPQRSEMSDPATVMFPLQPLPPDQTLPYEFSDEAYTVVHFLIRSNPMEEARECVRTREEAARIHCFGFNSREMFLKSGPITDGSLTEGSCYEVIWRRISNGRESGGINSRKVLLGGASC